MKGKYTAVIILLSVIITGGIIFGSNKAKADTVDVGTATINFIENYNKGIRLEWKAMSGAAKYGVYMRGSKNDEWENVSVTKNGHVVSAKCPIKNKKVKRYEFIVTGLKNLPDEQIDAYKPPKHDKNIKTYISVKPPRSVVAKKGRRVTVKWTKVSGSDGYIIQYSNSPLMLNTRQKTVKGGNKKRININLRMKGSRCYARVKAYKVSGKSRIASAWKYSLSYRGYQLCNIKYFKSKGIVKNYRQRGTFKTLSVFQGSCSIGGYCYHVLNDVPKDVCRLIKIRLKNGKVVKKATKSFAGHGNDLTYNSKKGVIVATYYNDEKRSDSVVLLSPKTLNPIGVRKMTIPSEVPGVSSGNTKKAIVGISAISYIQPKGIYVARVKSKNAFVIMNENFVVLRYIKHKFGNDMIPQSMFAINDLLINLKSPEPTDRGKYNYGYVFDYHGNLITTLAFRKGNEMESLCMSGGKLYGGVYVPNPKGATRIITRRIRMPGSNKIKLIRRKVRVNSTGAEDYLFSIMTR